MNNIYNWYKLRCNKTNSNFNVLAKNQGDVKSIYEITTIKLDEKQSKN